MSLQDSINRQVLTRYRDDKKNALVTELVERPVRPVREGEVLAEMLFVPIHGSFWLASHPDAIHPRKDEFLAAGEFVFGNGGVSRVLAVSGSTNTVKTGDYISIFGHIPCGHEDCNACRVLHRYTECDYGEGKILGHGKNAPDGTLARYCILPVMACEVCFPADRKPTERQLLPYMFSFLFADVRNALTRHPDILSSKRMLLFGAGNSGHIAAYLYLQACPEARIFVVDVNRERLRSIQTIAPCAIAPYCIPNSLADELNQARGRTADRSNYHTFITELSKQATRFFGGRKCDVLFDASSGNTAPLWDNPQVLGPGVYCIPFGFGSDCLVIDSALIQLSGLHIVMSRGVGTLRNRQETVDLIRAGASEMIHQHLLGNMRRLNGLEETLVFIKAQHKPPKPLHQIPAAYMCLG